MNTQEKMKKKIINTLIEIKKYINKKNYGRPI